MLDAVVAELAEHGYDGLTTDAVAARAGVHRTTVYRRWGDVGGLLADVLDAASDDEQFDLEFDKFARASLTSSSSSSRPPLAPLARY